MQTKQIDRTEEKVKLAKELGIHGYVDFVNSLNLKFNKITQSEIAKKIGAGRTIYKPSFRNDMLGVAAFHTFLSAFCFYLIPKDAVFTITVWAVVMLVITGCSLFKTVYMESMPLSMWEENMPYGALLAVKEAREQGLERMTIWYPTLQRRRLKEDPVITGEDAQGNLREIFAWDDGKIYE